MCGRGHPASQSASRATPDKVDNPPEDEKGLSRRSSVQAGQGMGLEKWLVREMRAGPRRPCRLSA